MVHMMCRVREALKIGSSWFTPETLVDQFCKSEFSEEEGSLGIDGDSQIDFFIFLPNHHTEFSSISLWGLYWKVNY